LRKAWTARDSARYNYDHKRARKRWEPVVASGRVRCGRCRLMIEPGALWDLDHIRPDFSVPSHRRCNRATASHRVEARRVSREW
jgi:hypothetical protein